MTFRPIVPLLIVFFIGLSACASSESVSGGLATTGNSTAARVVQPGAPGQPSRTMSADEIPDNPTLPHTAADTRFMQGMIPHHSQALDMSVLVSERTNRRDVNLLAQRITTSQKSEIALMKRWLRSRGETVPDDNMHRLMIRGETEMAPMPGMLTLEQMNELRESTGSEFERLYLTYMIGHHQGALTMVEHLFASPGAAQDSDMFKFANDVDTDQTMEIGRMQRMLRQTPGVGSR